MVGNVLVGIVLLSMSVALLSESSNSLNNADFLPAGEQEFMPSESMDRSTSPLSTSNALQPSSTQLSYSLMRSDLDRFRSMMQTQLHDKDPSNRLPELLNVYIDSISHQAVTEDNFQAVQEQLLRKLASNENVHAELRHRGLHLGYEISDNPLVPVEVTEFFLAGFEEAISRSAVTKHVSRVSLIVAFVSSMLCLFGPGCYCCPTLLNIMSCKTSCAIATGSCCLFGATNAHVRGNFQTATDFHDEYMNIVRREKQLVDNVRDKYRLNPVQRPTLPNSMQE